MGRRPKDYLKNKIKRPKMKTILQAPKGMPDILPEENLLRRKIFKAVEDLGNFYGFGQIETPVLEETKLFLHGTGPTSEIVQKQMFILKTPGKDLLALRPEFTPNIVRAYLENGLYNNPKPVKLFAWGPVFRYEQPQRGRYRQFWQCNFEILGSADPIYDALTIQIFYNLFTELKMKELMIEINTIGCDNCRPIWHKNLKNYFRSKRKFLCADCKNRLKINPLRILDCKNESCQSLKNGAPKMIDFLCPECRKHFKQILEYLEILGLPYNINHHLVRGLDYYTKTVFEIRLASDNLALCGGGRYDYLVEMLGGKSTPAVGGAAGIERLVEVLKKNNFKVENPYKPKVFLIAIGDLAKQRALKYLEALRKVKIPVAESFAHESLKAQLRQADKWEAPYVIIIGQKEALDNTIILRDMKASSQEVVESEKMIEELKKRFKNDNIENI
ncbi:MAG: histidine--tRNA ligase [Candidatus Pacebacteria bacterium]|nr:histidine--tRNA ligase [Candidatus Paceibacterota bacterium]